MTDAARWSRWRALLVFSLTIPAVGFMSHLAAKYWNEVWTWIVDAQPLLIFISLAALLASFYGSALLFVASIQGTSGLPAHDSQHKLIAAFLLSQIGKYVPGRIWAVVLQKALLGAELPMHSVILTNLELTGLSLALAIGSAVISMSWLFFGIALGYVALVVVSIGLYFLLALKLTARASSILQRLLRGNDRLVAGNSLRVKTRSDPTATGLTLYGGGYYAGWLCLMFAGGSADLDESLQLTVLISLSYVIGVVSLLPAGVGAREAAMLIIGDRLGLDNAALASVAIVTRLALLLVELSAALLGAAMLILQRRGGKFT